MVETVKVNGPDELNFEVFVSNGDVTLPPIKFDDRPAAIAWIDEFTESLPTGKGWLVTLQFRTVESWDMRD